MLLPTVVAVKVAVTHASICAPAPAPPRPPPPPRAPPGWAVPPGWTLVMFSTCLANELM
ncbi:MAG: hypothetical protein QOH97_4681 [Actinoplanes sp.]|nr:hypothetical protein [Actinoplanes sp.]